MPRDSIPFRLHILDQPFGSTQCDGTIVAESFDKCLEGDEHHIKEFERLLHILLKECLDYIRNNKRR